MHIDWDEIRTVETLVRTGSIAAAARELGLQHSSISRRVDALERTLGLPLFLRGARLEPTALARAIAEQALPMAEAAGQIDAVVEAERRRREQRLVITTNDVLAPLLFRGLATIGGDQLVQVRLSDVELELAPGMTDLALRPGSQPRGSLRGWRLGKLRVGLYRSSTFDGEGWILPSPELRRRASMRWWKAIPEKGPGQVECDSLLAMRDACLAGLGVAALPALMALDEPRLHLDREIPGGSPVWLLASATRRSDPVLRRLAGDLVGALRGLSDVWAP